MAVGIVAFYFYKRQDPVQLDLLFLKAVQSANLVSL
jgi:hypothetical protein